MLAVDSTFVAGTTMTNGINIEKFFKEELWEPERIPILQSCFLSIDWEYGKSPGLHNYIFTDFGLRFIVLIH